jgi:hypothetical protein
MTKSVIITASISRGLLLVSLFFGVIACSNSPSDTSGHCSVDKESALHCGTLLGNDGGIELSRDFVSYSCSGTARPDGEPTYIEGIPRGTVCAARGERDGKGLQGYCCTARTTSCAYDPVAICEDSSFYGYQCWGATRPESYNPTLNCTNGVLEDDLINYCCIRRVEHAPTARCTPTFTECSSRLTGWQCVGESLPKNELLERSKSKADFFYFICSTRIAGAEENKYNYCCFTPKLVPPGGTCVQNTVLQGCEKFQFGFSCYGPDTPEDNYPPMHCPKPGVSGRSAEGYPATNYCCDFQ